MRGIGIWDKKASSAAAAAVTKFTEMERRELSFLGGTNENTFFGITLVCVLMCGSCMITPGRPLQHCLCLFCLEAQQASQHPEYYFAEAQNAHSREESDSPTF